MPPQARSFGSIRPSNRRKGDEKQQGLAQRLQAQAAKSPVEFINLGIRCEARYGGLFSNMTTLTLDLPEALTAELDAAVEAGWFANQAEAVRAAVRDFVSHGKLALQEKQQLADIEWAVDAAKQRP